MKWGVIIIALLLTPSVCLAGPKIDPQTCAQLIEHKPDATVAYKPSVTQPADITSRYSAFLKKSHAIPLTVDLMNYVGMDAGNVPYDSMSNNQIPLGTLTIKGSKAYLNGTPLSDAQQEKLVGLCR